ncbi:inositol monophosphatase [Tabrizicola sp. J26]|uniref:inositol monophosphatase family protein n=1 Tax=Alitabrizicola rongguiensis TaxID=2909234 RepID=UPI001F388923|nr:inositol monophosphatase family protein [Tabrizicola rongguiensis]MCF1708850.1 inositol monophosphatase [Tabrizicola rongguiensis]
MPDPDPRLYATALREIMQAAREVPLGFFRKALDVESKADASPVTRADRQTEERLRSEIAKRFPGHGILGEEFGGAQDAEFLWVIDPIDGTKSFISGHPLWGMLLGLLHDGKPLVGGIQAPVMGEVAWGGPGLGAFLNDRPVRVRKVDPSDSFICINELRRVLAKEPQVAFALMDAGRTVRESADCYSYLQLAAGWVDGVVDYGLEPYDYLPVLPVVEAAGGVMTDWQGNPLRFGSDGRVVAGSPAVHAHLLEVIARAGG